MNKINIAELLKDCPKGMELDCTMLDKVILDGVDNSNDPVFPIRVRRKDGCLILLTKYGQYFDDDYAKCVIFPKGKTTWEGFQRPFNDGDIIYNILQKKICVYYLCEDGVHRIKDCRYNESNKQLQFEKLKYPIPIVIQDYRIATEEEKAKLFKSIRDNGYKWNPETKTLEKLVEPKFKVGDKIFNVLRKLAGASGTQGVILEITDDKYIFTDGSYIYISSQDNWELEKSVKPKFKVGDKIKHKCEKFRDERTIISYGKSGYWTSINDWIDYECQDDWELVSNKFDITTLKPFDKVLVRDFDNTPWEIEFFSRLLDGKHFKCLELSYMQCIPYEGHEHLLGTNNDCDKHFKNWE